MKSNLHMEPKGLKFKGSVNLDGCLALLLIFLHFNFLQTFCPNSLPGVGCLFFCVSLPKCKKLYIQLTIVS